MALVKHLNPSQIPLALYIHFPWCVRKCPYCDFNSHQSKGALPYDAYIDCLVDDFKQSYELIAERPLVSIFMGGGTPSLFQGEHIGRLLQAISEYTPLPEEITLEANPGTIEHDSFVSYHQAGITRISLGVQSFNQTCLKKIGRIHDSDQAKFAVEQLKQAGFKRWNIDLMHGLPEQTLEDALLDLEQAMAFEPPHLSWYQLTIEPNTAFYQKPPTLPQNQTLDDIYFQGHTLLKQKGYQQYEVSAFSRSQPSQHNLNYWRFGDYLGIGAGAHSKITQADKITRWVRWRHPKDYLNAQTNFVSKNTNISKQDLSFEFMLNAMRLANGFPLALFEAHTGLSAQHISPVLNQALEKDLIILDDDHVIPTEHGRLFLNDLIGLFLPHEH